MSIVSSFNMPASNLIHASVHDSGLQRKRFLDDLDESNDSKRSRTAPPSPPLVPSAPVSFRRRSLSPTPPSPFSANLPLSPPNGTSSVITPASPVSRLAEPVYIEKATPILSVSTVASTSNATTSGSAPLLSTPTSLPLPHLPPVSSLTQSTPLPNPLSSPKQDLKLPSLKHLTSERFGGISRYSLDYPDTCVNDDDWRMNLEVWIEKNFPEKFNNLKNILRFDKPGFELLNDAIFLTELKEQLDQDRSSQLKPEFNSRISTKMVQKKENPYYTTTRRASSDHAIIQSPYSSRLVQQEQQKPEQQQSHSSPIAATTQLHTSSYPYTSSNYTYSNIQSPTTPTSKTSLSSPQKQSHSSPSRSSTWTGHHKLEQQPVILNNNFIHTQTHKGPNHTYTIHHHNAYKRVCISCGTDQSPCWRPSWSVTAGQLCNSCGLRYKKTGARCVEKNCCRIPAKGEWLAMENRGKLEIKKADGSTVLAYKCLHCGGEVDTKEKK